MQNNGTKRHYKSTPSACLICHVAPVVITVSVANCQTHGFNLLREEGKNLVQHRVNKPTIGNRTKA